MLTRKSPDGGYVSSHGRFNKSNARTAFVAKLEIKLSFEQERLLPSIVLMEMS